MVGHEDVGVECQPIALAIARQTRAVIRVVMKDRRAAIPASEHVVERAGNIGA